MLIPKPFTVWQILFIAMALAGGAVFVFQPLQQKKIGVEFSKSEAANQTFGWDYNLTKKCVKSTNS